MKVTNIKKKALATLGRQQWIMDLFAADMHIHTTEKNKENKVCNLRTIIYQAELSVDALTRFKRIMQHGVYS